MTVHPNSCSMDIEAEPEHFLPSPSKTPKTRDGTKTGSMILEDPTLPRE